MPYIKLREKGKVRMFSVRLYFPGLRITYYYELYARTEKRAREIFDMYLRSWCPFKDHKKIFSIKKVRRKPFCCEMKESLISLGTRKSPFHIPTPYWRGENTL